MSIFEKSREGFGITLRYYGDKYLYFERFEARQMLKELSIFISEWDAESDKPLAKGKEKKENGREGN